MAEECEADAALRRAERRSKSARKAAKAVDAEAASAAAAVRARAAELRRLAEEVQDEEAAAEHLSLSFSLSLSLARAREFPPCHGRAHAPFVRCFAVALLSLSCT